MELIDAIVRAREIKKALDNRVQGRVMIRQDKAFKGNQLFKIWDFNVYYENPIPANKNAIQQTLKSFGAKFGEMRVIGGAYGFVIHFTLGDKK